MKTKKSSAMKPFVWTCPLCPETQKIVRSTSEECDMAVAAHIIEYHENKVAIKAVDNARMECSKTDCEIGTNKKWNGLTGCSEPKWTKFDRDLLSQMKILPD